MSDNAESLACVPQPINPDGFNWEVNLPYGLEIEQLSQAMNAFLSFLGFINQELNRREIARLEMMLMPANFSSIVGEFMTTSIPKFSPTLAKNKYHNGHPDLVPLGMYPNDAVQHSNEGIEIKASRYLRGWQGHNPEDTWLMIFVFDSNRPRDNAPRPFRFVQVAGARLEKSDWILAGRQRDESPHDNSECDNLGLSQNDGELDLSRCCYSCKVSCSTSLAKLRATAKRAN